MSKSQGLGKPWLNLPAMSDFVTTRIPAGSKVKFITADTLKNYFYYFSYPQLKIVEEISQADFLVIYYSPMPYSFVDDIFYLYDGEKMDKIGKYIIPYAVFQGDKENVILKKK